MPQTAYAPVAINRFAGLRRQRRKAGPETAKRLKGPKQPKANSNKPSPNKGLGQILPHRSWQEQARPAADGLISSSWASSHHSPRRLSNINRPN